MRKKHLKLHIYSVVLCVEYGCVSSNVGSQISVLDLMQERFHNMSPSDFESTFIEAGDNETKEGLKIEEARSQQQE